MIEIDEVLEAIIASGFSTGQSRMKILRLTSSFSVAASITRSQSPRSLESVGPGWMRASAWRRSASSIVPFCDHAWPRLPLMVASPAWMRSSAMSFSTTS